MKEGEIILMFFGAIFLLYIAEELRLHFLKKGWIFLKTDKEKKR